PPAALSTAFVGTRPYTRRTSAVALPSLGDPGSDGNLLIHILDLLPGSGEDEICCEEQVAGLHDGEDYEVHSYVWSDPGDTRTIKASEEDAQLTSNLHNALRRLRMEHLKGSLWVDQICID